MSNVSDRILSGLLFDFMGWMTSRETSVTLSASNDAGPAVERIKEFCRLRGIDTNSANINWEMAIRREESSSKRRESLRPVTPEMASQGISVVTRRSLLSKSGHIRGALSDGKVLVEMPNKGWSLLPLNEVYVTPLCWLEDLAVYHDSELYRLDEGWKGRKFYVEAVNPDGGSVRGHTMLGADVSMHTGEVGIRMNELSWKPPQQEKPCEHCEVLRDRLDDAMRSSEKQHEDVKHLQDMLGSSRESLKTEQARVVLLTSTLSESEDKIESLEKRAVFAEGASKTEHERVVYLLKTIAKTHDIFIEAFGQMGVPQNFDVAPKQKG